MGVLAMSVVGCGPTITLFGSDTGSVGTGTGGGPLDGGVLPTQTTDAGDCSSTTECPGALVCIDNVCVDNSNDDYEDGYDDDYTDDYTDLPPDGYYDGYKDDYYTDDIGCYSYGPQGQCCDYAYCPTYCYVPSDCPAGYECVVGSYDAPTCTLIPVLSDCATELSFVPLPVPIDAMLGEVETLSLVEADTNNPGRELVIGHEFGAPSLVRHNDPSIPQLLPMPDAIDNIGSGGVVAADFNADGTRDLVVIAGDGDAHLLTGDGIGGFVSSASFAAEFIAGTGNPQLGVLDFAGASGTDVVGITVGNIPLVLLGDGAGGFDTTVSLTVPGGEQAFALTTGNVEGVSPSDVVVSTSTQAHVYSGTFFPPNPLDPSGSAGLQRLTVDSVRGLAAADFDSDGIDAVVGVNDQLGVTVLQTSVPEGSGNYLVPFTGELAGAADLDGDGVPDLALVGDTLHWAHGVAAVGANVFDCFGSARFVADFPEVFALGDFDGNGRADIATSDGTEVIVYMGVAR